MNPHRQRWSQALDGVRRRVEALPSYRRSGCIVRATGMVLEAVGLRIPLGGVCRIELAGHGHDAGLQYAEAEVVGFAGERLYLMPLEEISGLQPGARVLPPRAATASARAASRSASICSAGSSTAAAGRWTARAGWARCRTPACRPRR